MAKKLLGITPVVNYTTSASNVTVPKGVKGMWLTMIAAGGGGGSGRRGASFSNRYGGEGGQGGGGMVDVYVPIARLGSTYSVTVSSSGGAGGGAQTVNSVNGNAGTKGGDTVFTSGSLTWTVTGGNGGQGGGTAAQTSSRSSSANTSGRLYGDSGGVGGINGGGEGGYLGDQGQWAAPGGGGGGGVSSGNAAGGGGDGAESSTCWSGGGSGGVVGGAAPTSGDTPEPGFFGGGGGGGAGSTSTTIAAQSGANASGYGAGGGGGGASTNGANSGAGGAGGPGYLRIVWDYNTDRQQLGTKPYVEYSDTTSVTNQTVPAGIKGAWVFMIGPGGGGGSGATVISSGTTYGGGGGNGGSVVHRWIPKVSIGSTFAVTIPSRRTGGAAVSASSTSGNSGQAAAYIELGFEHMNIYCDGGDPGAGGTTTAGASPGMSAGNAISYTSQGGPGGVSGTVSPKMNDWQFDQDQNGWEDYGGAAGGGAGGYISAGTPFAGYTGGNSRAYGQLGGIRGNGVVIPGGGSDAIAMLPASGAGGGSAQTTANAQNGGDATGYGGGGGGGGAAANTKTSGAGGMGGPGYVRITWDYI